MNTQNFRRATRKAIASALLGGVIIYGPAGQYMGSLQDDGQGGYVEMGPAGEPGEHIANNHNGTWSFYGYAGRYDGQTGAVPMPSAPRPRPPGAYDDDDGLPPLP